MRFVDHELNPGCFVKIGLCAGYTYSESFTDRLFYGFAAVSYILSGLTSVFLSVFTEAKLNKNYDFQARAMRKSFYRRKAEKITGTVSRIFPPEPLKILQHRIQLCNYSLSNGTQDKILFVILPFFCTTSSSKKCSRPVAVLVFSLLSDESR